MGISTNGVLVFGFPVGGEEENPLPDLLGDDVNFEDFIANEAGIGEWRGDFTDEQSKEHFAKVREAVRTYPVDLIMHCSYNYPMYFLAIRGKELSARRGYPVDLQPEFMTVAPEKIEAAKQWCSEHNIEWQEPKWYLASLYG